MSSSSSSWEPQPLHRHLSTVGIGPVFCKPPTHYQLPPSSVMCDNHPADGKKATEKQQQEYASISASNKSSSCNNKVIKTWEIVGDIKTTPQDFVVREIGWCPPPNYSSHAQDNSEKSNGDRSYMNKYTKRNGWRRGIAGLTESDDTSTHDDDDECREHVVSLATTEEKEPDAKAAACDAADEQQVDGKNCTSNDMKIAKKMKTTCSENIATKTLPIASSSPSPSPPHAAPSCPSTSTVDTTQSPPPDEVLRQILIQGCDSKEMIPHAAPDYADSIMKQLASLQNKAYEQLKDTSTKTSGTADEKSSDETKILHKEILGDGFGPLDDTNTVWISTSNLFKQDTTKGSWKLLHQTLRQVYPLLKTENASHRTLSKEDATASNDDNHNQDDENNKKNSKNSWVCALIDDCFFSLIPYLVHPAEDLFQLYMFRSLGPVLSATNEDCSRSNQTNNRKKNRWKKGKRDNQINNEDRSQKAKESNEGKVLLRLKPEIPRTERRNIHQIITGMNTRKSDFETSTRNDVSINGDENASGQTTSAIVVQWSRMALQNSQKKRKREESNSSIAGDNKHASNKSNSTAKDSSSDIDALFCTLKKEHVEHQVALQSLMRALKCRPGDIGLAGIKDMKAITYQFCTLRNVDMKRAQRPIMGDTKVSLSNFVLVKNFLLDRGRLIGNQFEITLRNLRQVERLEGDDKPSSWKERAVPVRSSHLDAMVNRVAKHGFINYYGEQRVGDAGHKEYVGVRSFEVGRALLQSNFALAVDLIMEGRSSNVYNPTQEEVSHSLYCSCFGFAQILTVLVAPAECSTNMDGHKRC